VIDACPAPGPVPERPLRRVRDAVVVRCRVASMIRRGECSCPHRITNPAAGGSRILPERVELGASERGRGVLVAGS